MPALAAIYLLRNRSRRQSVSSLMLWADLTRPRQGGRKLQRMQLPLLLLLELLAVAALIAAAADPHIRRSGARLSVVVVLDDSFSMQAGGEASPKQAALSALRRRFRGESFTMRLVLAGPDPTVLGEPVGSLREAEKLLERWRCQSPAADLSRAVTLARGIGGATSKILVLTDHPPADDLLGDQVVWQATGRARANQAIVSAMRSEQTAGQRCLLQVGNFADEASHPLLTVHVAATGQTLAQRELSLAAMETTTVFVDLPADVGEIIATLGGDALPLDSEVTLLPAAARTVRVRMVVADEKLRDAIRRGLDATGLAKLTSGRAPLLITDRQPSATADDVWTLRFVVDDTPPAYTGPFLTDNAHRLCEGLDLAGVIWAAGNEPPLPGRAVIAAGDVVLLTDSQGPGRRRLLRCRLQPNRSTLQESVNWVALLWNLLDERGESLPGVATTNARLGESVRINVPYEIETVDVRSPDGAMTRRDCYDGVVYVPADLCGRYIVQAGETAFTFAVNAVQIGESDLTGADSDTWGEWVTAGDVTRQYESVAMWPMLLALGLLALHLALIGRSSGGDVA